MMVHKFVAETKTFHRAAQTLQPAKLKGLGLWNPSESSVKNAQTGRAHDCFRQMHQSDQKRLAMPDPSTHAVAATQNLGNHGFFSAIR